ncbi:hypothetical protein [Aminivibrio pyruvatiphilus]|nr:hypothetical protein [Aminivibrio pyruvatiphilus]
MECPIFMVACAARALSARTHPSRTQTTAAAARTIVRALLFIFLHTSLKK